MWKTIEDITYLNWIEPTKTGLKHQEKSSFNEIYVGGIMGTQPRIKGIQWDLILILMGFHGIYRNHMGVFKSIEW